MVSGLFCFLNWKDCNFVDLKVLTEHIPIGRLCVLINCFAKISFVLIRAFNFGIVSG